MTNTTYLNPITWKTEQIPAEILAMAEKHMAHANDPKNGYKRGIQTELVSIQVHNVTTELVPNPRNIDTADTCKMMNWTFTEKVTLKVYKNGKTKTSVCTYHLYSQTIEVLEVGGYKNQNN